MLLIQTVNLDYLIFKLKDSYIVIISIKIHKSLISNSWIKK
jgi:hypothetical protein